MIKSVLQWKQNNLENAHSTKIQNILVSKKNFKISCIAIFSTLIQILIIKSCQKSQFVNINHEYAYIVAKTPIAKGVPINENNTKLAYLNLGDGKQSFILNSEFHKFSGEKSILNIDENTPILKSILINKNELTLQEKIPPGKRFYTLNVDLENITSLIQPGNTVDIIAHMNIQGYGSATETILNRIKIIAIGDDYQNNKSNTNANSLSFYLTPEEVKILSFMKPYSTFTVAIRNPNDFDASQSSPITFNQFIQNEKIQKIFENDTFKIIEGKKIEQ